MEQYVLKNSDLRGAARSYAAHRLIALDMAVEKDSAVPSPGLQNKIISLQEASVEAVKTKRRHTRRRLAAACFAVFLLLGAFFGFNKTARAEFTRWVKTTLNGDFVYQLFGDDTSSALPELTPGWLPEGFELTLHLDDPIDFYMYENHKGSGFDLTCLHYAGTVLQIAGAAEREPLTLNIGSYEVDYFPAPSEEGNHIYIWHDKDQKFVFEIISNLPHETNVKIIENLKYK